MRLWILITLFVLIAVNSAMGSPETCIGGLCLEDNVSLDKFTKTYGKGDRLSVGHSITSCFWVEKEHISVELTFDSYTKLLEAIFITKEKMCTSQSKVKLQTLATKKGISLGVNHGKVLKLYGKPSRIDNLVERERMNEKYQNSKLGAKFGDYAYVYTASDDELNAALFYIRNNHVQSIYVTIEE